MNKEEEERDQQITQLQGRAKQLQADLLSIQEALRKLLVEKADEECGHEIGQRFEYKRYRHKPATIVEYRGHVFEYGRASPRFLRVKKNGETGVFPAGVHDWAEDLTPVYEEEAS